MALAVIVLAAGCAQTSAQPGPPPPPQVTVAERHRARRDRMGRIHRTVTGGRFRRSPPARLRSRLPRCGSKKAPSSGAAIRCSRSTRVRSRPKSIGCAPSSLARVPRVSVRRPSSRHAEQLRAENAIAKEEHDRRAAFAQESTAQSAAVEAALRAAELNLEFTQGHVADRRPRRPRDRHRGQPGLERTGRSHAAHHRRLARSRLRLLRCRRADLSEVHRRVRKDRPHGMVRKDRPYAADSHGAGQ